MDFEKKKKILELIWFQMLFEGWYKTHYFFIFSLFIFCSIIYLFEKQNGAYCCLALQDSLIINNLYSKDGFTYGQSIQCKMLLVRLHVHRSIKTLYLTWQYWALPIQQQIEIWCQKQGKMGIQLSDYVENIVGKGEIARYEQFLLFPQCFQKLSVVDSSKWVSME